MGKFGTVAGIVGAVILCYLVILPLWTIITGTAFDAANTVNATANAQTYRATTAGLRFAPLALFITPAAIGIVAVYITLRFMRQDRQ